MEMNIFLEKLKQKGLLDGSMDSTSMIAENPLQSCGLMNMHCELCNDTGRQLRTDADGVMWASECSCMKVRRGKRALRNAGLEEIAERYNFENFTTPDERFATIKRKAMEYCDSDSPGFMICGQSGAGKSHICTAIFTEFCKRGFEGEYFQWRHDSLRLKQLIAAEPKAYRDEIERLAKVDVLYLDDLLKGSRTEADLNLVFELINARYLSKKRKTLVSTELSLQKLLEFDEAVGGRLVEMCRGYICQAPERNWRLQPC